MEAATRQTPAAVEMVAAQMQPHGLKLVEFLGFCADQFGPFEMTDEITALIGKDGDQFSDGLKQLLLKNGWCDRGFLLTLTGADEYVYAYIREDSFSGERGEQNWWGGFDLAHPFPDDIEVLRAELERRNRMSDDEYVECYRQNNHGLVVASIRANTMSVTEWYPEGINRRSASFLAWMRVFERMFDRMNLDDSWSKGEQMLERVTNPYWQWSTSSDEEIKAVLQQIADTSKDRKEIRRRIYEELGYPGNIMMVTPSWSSRPGKTVWCVQIKSARETWDSIQVQTNIS